MLRSDLMSLLGALRSERAVYHYFPGRHAFVVLGLHVGEGASVRDVKRSRVSGLLGRPAVKDWLASNADGVLTRDRLQSHWDLRPTAYLLSWSWWGTDDAKQWYRTGYQTSRQGFNLVLQLNFSREHDAGFRRLLQADRWFDAKDDGHPVNKAGRCTLAWARIDVDLAAGEGLVEEIQSDWVRDARHLLERGRAPRRWKALQPLLNSGRVTRAHVQAYHDRYLQPHLALWQEAVLCAAVELLFDRLALRRVYYHSYDSSRWLKGNGGRGVGPRSLYSSLPKPLRVRPDAGAAVPRAARGRRVRPLPAPQAGPLVVRPGPRGRAAVRRRPRLSGGGGLSLRALVIVPALGRGLGASRALARTDAHAEERPTLPRTTRPGEDGVRGAKVTSGGGEKPRRCGGGRHGTPN